MRTASVRSTQTFRPLLGAVLLLATSACATEEGDPGYYTGSWDYVEVEVVPGLLAVGDTGQARLIAYRFPHTSLGELEARWGGDDDAVATVDSSGRIIVHALGHVSLATDLDPHPGRSGLYVSPESACGSALEVDQWALDGGFTWHGTATSGDSSIATHHFAEWTLSTEAPRQVNTGEIVWRIRRPTAASFVFTRRDTLTQGAVKTIDHGNAAIADSVEFSGEVRLAMSGCTLTADLYPRTEDVVARVRPGLSDSVIEHDFFPGPVSTADLGAVTITGTTTRLLGGPLPVMLPTDFNLEIGYAPTGYAALVAVFGGEAADSITLTQDLTPVYSVPTLARRR